MAKWLGAQMAKPEGLDWNPDSITNKSVTLHHLTPLPLFPHL